ncbi:hypothetical protein V1478_007741 [Vespula squamosa]|uniref:Uncharacterized protein n=1 Tax=Vespula squamosa TaxID=30214 RepID=A0ABD2AWT8_VESSQ
MAKDGSGVGQLNWAETSPTSSLARSKVSRAQRQQQRQQRQQQQPQQQPEVGTHKPSKEGRKGTKRGSRAELDTMPKLMLTKGGYGSGPFDADRRSIVEHLFFVRTHGYFDVRSIAGIVENIRDESLAERKAIRFKKKVLVIRKVSDGSTIDSKVLLRSMCQTEVHTTDVYEEKEESGNEWRTFRASSFTGATRYNIRRDSSSMRCPALRDQQTAVEATLMYPCKIPEHFKPDNNGLSSSTNLVLVELSSKTDERTSADSLPGFSKILKFLEGLRRYSKWCIA